MGYDMYWERISPEIDACTVEAHRLWAEVETLRGTEPEKAAVLAGQGSVAYGHYINGAEKCGAYFRVNIGGMDSLRKEMQAQGMLDLRKVPASDDVPIEYRAPAPVTGIPAMKFYANENWLVHPEEIRAALAKAQRTRIVKDPEWPDDEANAFWREWLDWLAKAAEHGGFRVR